MIGVAGVAVSELFECAGRVLVPGEVQQDAGRAMVGQFLVASAMLWV